MYGEAAAKANWDLVLPKLKFLNLQNLTWKRKQSAYHAATTIRLLLRVCTLNESSKIWTQTLPQPHLSEKKTNRCIFNANIQQFVLDLYCFFICTDSGKLITFGEAEGGKLGLPEDADDTTIPQEVTGIKGKVTWVSCGGSHTVAVTGRLFHLLFFQGFSRRTL